MTYNTFLDLDTYIYYFISWFSIVSKLKSSKYYQLNNLQAVLCFCNHQIHFVQLKA